MVKNLPASAGDMGSVSDLGRAHTPSNLCPTREATTMETRSPQLESSPHSSQLEKSLHSNEDLTQLKINKTKPGLPWQYSTNALVFLMHTQV